MGNRKDNTIRVAAGFFLVLLLTVLIQMKDEYKLQLTYKSSDQRMHKKAVPSTSAVKCADHRSYGDKNMKSQSEEDKQILYGEGIGFDQICGGTYIEMGALDGVLFSNSFIFHNAFGSSSKPIKKSIITTPNSAKCCKVTTSTSKIERRGLMAIPAMI